MASEYSITLENVHVDVIHDNLCKDNFECTLAKGIRFVSERGISYITDSTYVDINYSYEIDNGKTEIPEYNADFYLTDKKVNKTFLKVYKKSIQADLSSAIICGRLFIRPKRDGDSVFYGGITRKLKKLFNDRKIPISKRSLIPILCDDKGVVWVPGFGVRDDGNNGGCGPYVTLAIRDSDEKEGYSFFYEERNK
jgi:tRNA(Ile)-lysidine synthase